MAEGGLEQARPIGTGEELQPPAVKIPSPCEALGVVPLVKPRIVTDRDFRLMCSSAKSLANNHPAFLARSASHNPA